MQVVKRTSAAEVEVVGITALGMHDALKQCTPRERILLMIEAMKRQGLDDMVLFYTKCLSDKKLLSIMGKRYMTDDDKRYLSSLCMEEEVTDGE